MCLTRNPAAVFVRWMQRVRGLDTEGCIMEYCLAVKPLTVTQEPPPLHQKNNHTQREGKYNLKWLALFTMRGYWGGKKAIKAQTGRAEPGYYYSVKPWVYLIHILEDCPFVACWKAIKGADSKNDCLASTPLSYFHPFSPWRLALLEKHMWLL